MTNTKRVNISLNKHDHNSLKALAKAKKTTLSKLISTTLLTNKYKKNEVLDLDLSNKTRIECLNYFIEETNNIISLQEQEIKKLTKELLQTKDKTRKSILMGIPFDSYDNFERYMIKFKDDIDTKELPKKEYKDFIKMFYKKRISAIVFNKVKKQKEVLEKIPFDNFLEYHQYHIDNMDVLMECYEIELVSDYMEYIHTSWETKKEGH
jgi:predicted DNA-binding ribbon-helix-helix protein